MQVSPPPKTGAPSLSPPYHRDDRPLLIMHPPPGGSYVHICERDCPLMYWPKSKTYHPFKYKIEYGLTIYAVEDRIPRACPWMNEPFPVSVLAEVGSVPKEPKQKGPRACPGESIFQLGSFCPQLQYGRQRDSISNVNFNETVLLFWGISSQPFQDGG